MNEEIATELALSWAVETRDIGSRVAAATGCDPLASELRTIRSELAELRRGNDTLLAEIARLRVELAERDARRTSRLSPYTPTESLARVN